jgi:hypothetical protein
MLVILSGIAESAYSRAPGAIAEIAIRAERSAECAEGAGDGMELWTKQTDDSRAPSILDPPADRLDLSDAGVRCPLCAWRPRPDDLWICADAEAPEYFLGGCGTEWNTFTTRGRCPGCSHQWRWTSCLACEQWSLHEEWYEDERPG